MKNSTIDSLLTKLLPGPDLHSARAPGTLGIFLKILLIKKVKTKKSLTSERGAPGIVSHGKFGPGSCITFLVRFDEGLG